MEIGNRSSFQQIHKISTDSGKDEKWEMPDDSHQILVGRKKIIEIFKTSISNQKSPNTVLGNLLFVLLFPMYVVVLNCERLRSNYRRLKVASYFKAKGSVSKVNLLDSPPNIEDFHE
jgi:hypothetical protein